MTLLKLYLKEVKDNDSVNPRMIYVESNSGLGSNFHDRHIMVL